MTISIIESGAAMRRMAECGKETWGAAVEDLWAPMAGMYHFVPGDPDLVAVHAQNFGFGPDAPTGTVHQAVDSLEQADAWGRIESALTEGLDRLAAANPTMTMPDLTVLLVLGDPLNKHFMEEIRGLSAFGGISGYIALTVWPTDEILERLEAIALHELHHNVRYSPGGVVWDPGTVTVGEHVVSEGLADSFAAETYGGRGYAHFVSEETRRDDGVLARVVEGLDVTGMQNFGAWVLGDSTAELFGGAPVGLPTGAGYAAGVRIVDAYLAETGGSAADAATVPSADILAVALPRLGMHRSDE